MSEGQHKSRDGGRRGRTGLVAVMIIALAGSVAATQWQLSVRNAPSTARTTSKGSSLSRLNSYALGLLLGGFRGPLVMMLWTTSESQKASRNLEDFDTKVEWIRLLQPEFDSVHIFQIWNKAYNVSVQMASLSNKYVTILDAIDYAERMSAERPDNINIIVAEAQVWSDKLGSAAEKFYYRPRVRAETSPHKLRMSVPKGDPAWRRVELDPMLDDQGMLLPELVKATREKPVTPKIDEGPTNFDDGAPMGFLRQFEPYPHGLSPFAIAFNLYKRAQLLQSVYNQRHAQLSDQVIDSRPPLTLKLWSEEEWELARRRELAAFGLEVPAERLDMEPASAGIGPGSKVVDDKALDEAIFSLKRSADLAAASYIEYQRHLTVYRGNVSTYRLHLDEMQAHIPLGAADAAYLRWCSGRSTDAAADKADAIKSYTLAMEKYALITLKFYFDDALLKQVLPGGVGRAGLDQIPIEQLPALRRATMVAAAQHGLQADAMAEDRQEYDAYMGRSETRLAILKHSK